VQRVDMQEADFRNLAHAAAGVDLFKPLKGGQLDSLLSHIRLYSCEAGEVIFRKGDTADAFYIIESGQVGLIFRSLWFWLWRRVTRLGPGQIFGEMALLDQAPRSATVIAREPTRLFVLLKSDFDEVLRQNPAFAAELREIVELRKFEMRNLHP
jgi:CRP/FNR family transcriptional regulator, cyclic AMP receptor protein